MKSAIVFTALLILAACAPKAVVKTSAPKAEAPVAVDTAPVASADTEASLRGREFAAVEGVGPIYFSYDSAQLGQASLDALKANAEYLKTHTDQDVLVAGNCDARGTVEYNLALGQKRAKAVREYYMRLGVPGTSIATISYGKEKPACSDSAESCYSKNRRADTLVRPHGVANDKTPAQ
jgi:peptidoglycan-associated lipoprotein